MEQHHWSLWSRHPNHFEDTGGDLATAAETGNSFALLTVTLLQPSAFQHIPRVRASSLQNL